MLKYNLFELPISEAKFKAAERPSVTALHSQHDGSLLCGLSFCKPLLFRIVISDKSPKFVDLKLEEAMGDSAYAITQGLRSNISGITACAVLHDGFLPNFLKSVAGGDCLSKTGKELLDFIFANDGGMGAVARHSVVQIANDGVSLRRFKEPGVLIDVAHIGDFIFGLGGSSIWREPYLNSEKREVLRKNLGKNHALHRDDSGNFWLVGANSRLQRMEQTDIKSKPTVLMFPAPEFEVSAASETDGWLYSTSNDGRDLYRVRRNPISFEEEMNKVGGFSGPISGLVALDREENSVLVVSVESPDGAEIHTVALIKPEDPELPPPPASPILVGKVPEIRCVSSLTLDRSDAAKKTIWGGESRLGCGEKGFKSTRLVQISQL